MICIRFCQSSLGKNKSCSHTSMVPVFQSFVGLFCDGSGVAKCPSWGGVWNTTAGYFRILLKIFEYVLRLPSENCLAFLFLRGSIQGYATHYLALHMNRLTVFLDTTSKAFPVLLQLATGHRDRWRFGQFWPSFVEMLRKHQYWKKQNDRFEETWRRKQTSPCVPWNYLNYMI